MFYSTDGRFEQLYDRANGLVIVEATSSPAETGRNLVPPITGDRYPLVPLATWSDVTFLVWKHLTSGSAAQRRGIQGVIVCEVNAGRTLPIVRRILENRGLYDDWDSYFPGLELRPEIDAEKEDFFAMLGTPSVYGTAYLLIQHREELGWKAISGVQFFRDQHSKLCVVIKIQQVGPDEEDERREDREALPPYSA